MTIVSRCHKLPIIEICTQWNLLIKLEQCTTALGLPVLAKRNALISELKLLGITILLGFAVDVTQSFVKEIKIVAEYTYSVIVVAMVGFFTLASFGQLRCL